MYQRKSQVTLKKLKPKMNRNGKIQKSDVTKGYLT